MTVRLLAAFFVFAALLPAADFKAGAGRVAITPDQPINMIGYANVNRVSEGKVHDLWAKALALEDSGGGRVVIVTLDLAVIPRMMAGEVATRVQKQFGLERSRLVLNVSHTHSGPALAGKLLNPGLIYELTPEQTARIAEYTAQVVNKIVSVVGQAVQDLAPANVCYGTGQVGFAVNRREKTAKGVRIGVNPDGPTDHEVPVLKVTTPEGKVKAVLFGFACHNTVLGGDNRKLCGDYAGFAQIEVENSHQGATALFMALCGADQAPIPKGSLEIAAKHGGTLAAEVTRVMNGNLQRVRGPIRPAFEIVEMAFAPHTRETFETRLNESNPLRVRHAKVMLRTYDEGRPIRTHPYPVQLIGFGRDLALFALGGEVVVDYDLRIKKELGPKGIIVAGYSNDVMGYIPTLQILQEGGHEGGDSMIAYGQPGPWDRDVEARIFSGIRKVWREIGR